MRHRPEITEIGLSAARITVLVVVFLTLVGFTMVSHLFNNARAERIACVENQRVMVAAFDLHREAHAGINADALDSLWSSYTGPSQDFGRCPADRNCTYMYDSGRGAIQCPNPFHQSGL